MRIYSDVNVVDAALDRIRFLFDEFPNIIVGFSGGKDSTIILELVLKIAEEKNRLPVKLFFLDQEAEWGSVIDYIRRRMSDDRIEPWWFQIPIKIFNATSTIEPWLECWKPGEEWIREKETFSFKENKYGTDRFHDIFKAIIDYEFPDTKSCYISGVRAEESPSRNMALTQFATYKYITWGNKLNPSKNHYTFYPIYDWSYKDVWKYINENNCDYCDIYDQMYSYGVKVQNMRVSNIHHETAVHSLFYLQEIEAETWNKVTNRLSGLNTASKIGEDDFFIKSLPYMFNNWIEYRDYLLDNLITDNKISTSFRNKFDRMEVKWGDIPNKEKMYKAQINSILTNDWEFVKLMAWEVSPANIQYRKYRKNN